MTKETIIRAWKDVEYRNSMSASERALLPSHPAGDIDLTDLDLENVAGAIGPLHSPSTAPLFSPSTVLF
jgi:mersacidin/lichenicidin family type 2 lantibiotic